MMRKGTFALLSESGRVVKDCGGHWKATILGVRSEKLRRVLPLQSE